MDRPSRRDFARLTGAALGAALLPKTSLADEKKPAAATSARAPQLPPASQAEAEARVQAIVARRGARLSPAERAELSRQSVEAQALLDAVRAFSLDDADEPAVTFRAARPRR